MKASSTITPSVGLDMSLRRFCAAVWFGPKRCLQSEFDNTLSGFRKLDRWLKTHGVGASLRLGVESTNTFAEAVLEWLYHAGYCVYLLNPEHVAFYARSLGQRNKTDPADAQTIAAYVATHEGSPWQPPSPEQKTLRQLTRTRLQLTQTATALSNQRRTAAGPGRAALDAVISEIRKQIASLIRQIRALLKAFPTLGECVRRLMTIKGIGLVTAAALIAELPPITSTTDPRTICGWAGLTPRRWQSGQTEWRSRLSRKGNAYVRHALYMPALVAKRFNPLLKTFAATLAAKGKSNGAILGAISHKLLRIAVGLLRTHTDFDPHWSYQKN
jgi:transposase